MIPFRSYANNRSMGLTSQANQEQQVVPIGGIPIGTTKMPPRYFSFALDNINEADEELPVLRANVLLDEDDIKFLLQFPKFKWKNALAWRYGEGLMWACKTGKDVYDELTLKYEGNKKSRMVFHGVKLYLKKKIELLTRHPDNGGYGFNLMSAWHETPLKLTGGKIEKIFSTGNYISPTQRCWNQRVDEWWCALASGWLGKPEGSQFHHFAEPEEEEQGKREPKKPISLAWDGRLLNGSSGPIFPVFTKAHRDAFDPEFAELTESEGGILLAKHHWVDSDSGGVETSEPEAIPFLMSGKLFTSGGLSDYRACLINTNREFQELRLHLPESVTKMPILTMEQLAELSNRSPNGKQVFERIKAQIDDAVKYTPGSGDEREGKEIPLEKDIVSRWAGSAQKTTGLGAFMATQSTGAERKIRQSEVDAMGLAKSQFHDLVDFFWTDDKDHAWSTKDKEFRVRPKKGQTWDDLEPVIGSFVRRIAADGLNAQLTGSARMKMPPQKIEVIRSNHPIYLRDLKARMDELSAYDPIRTFIANFVKETGAKTPEEAERAIQSGRFDHLKKDYEEVNLGTGQPGGPISLRTKIYDRWESNAQSTGRRDPDEKQAQAPKGKDGEELDPLSQAASGVSTIDPSGTMISVGRGAKRRKTMQKGELGSETPEIMDRPMSAGQFNDLAPRSVWVDKRKARMGYIQSKELRRAAGQTPEAGGQTTPAASTSMVPSTPMPPEHIRKLTSDNDFIRKLAGDPKEMERAELYAQQHNSEEMRMAIKMARRHMEEGFVVDDKMIRSLVESPLALARAETAAIVYKSDKLLEATQKARKILKEELQGTMHPPVMPKPFDPEEAEDEYDPSRLVGATPSGDSSHKAISDFDIEQMIDDDFIKALAQDPVAMARAERVAISAKSPAMWNAISKAKAMRQQ